MNGGSHPLLVLGLIVRAAASHTCSRAEFSPANRGAQLFSALLSSLGLALLWRGFRS